MNRLLYHEDEEKRYGHCLLAKCWVNDNILICKCLWCDPDWTVVWRWALRTTTKCVLCVQMTVPLVHALAFVTALFYAFGLNKRCSVWLTLLLQLSGDAISARVVARTLQWNTEWQQGRIGSCYAIKVDWTVTILWIIWRILSWDLNKLRCSYSKDALKHALGTQAYVLFKICRNKVADRRTT